jgi:hypothetical protein
MTQISNNFLTRLPAMAADDQTFKAVDGKIETSQTGIRGKIAAFFRSNGTVAARNQAVLDAVARDLKSQFGEGTTNTLNLPKDLLDGKRPITGRDIKTLVTNLTRNTQISSAVTNMTNTLNAVLNNPDSTPADVLKTLNTELPKGVTDAGLKFILAQSFSKLTPAQNSQLAGVLNSQETANITGLLQDTETAFAPILDPKSKNFLSNQKNPSFPQVQAGHSQSASMLTVINACKESLRLELAARPHAGPLGTNVPEAAPTAQHNWLNASPQLKAVMTTLGIPNPLETGKESLNALELQADSLFRGNTVGEKLVKASLTQALQPATQKLAAELLPLFRGAPAAHECKEWLGDHLTADKRAEILEKIQSNAELKTALQECIRLTTELKPLIAQKLPGEDINKLMHSAFNGLAMIALTSIISNSSANQIGDDTKYSMQAMAVFLQMEGAPRKLEEDDSILRNYFGGLEGWHEMLAPLP